MAAGRQRVLVVDDVDEMRTLIQRALSAGGYEVDVAATLSEAQQLNPGGYDVLLVDAGLGAEQGTDLVTALLLTDPAAAGRCLVITGGAADTIPDGVACLTKPFQLGELLDAVHGLDRPRATGRPRASAGPGASAGPTMAPEPPAATASAAAEPPAWRLLRLVRQLRARERLELVDFLHDGPIQQLTAIALELQMMSRAPRPGPAPSFDAVLRRLDSAAGSLRWLVDGHWPFQLPETRLAAALQQRTAWMLAAPVTVDAEASAAGPLVTEVPVIVDVVELMLLGTVPADPAVHAHVAVRAAAREIEIELTLTAASGDAQPVSDQESALAALGELASALGAAAQVDLHDQRWRARVALPRSPGPDGRVTANDD
jgi:DNA-binding response OmpR family regulator